MYLIAYTHSSILIQLYIHLTTNRTTKKAPTGNITLSLTFIWRHRGTDYGHQYNSDEAQNSTEKWTRATITDSSVLLPFRKEYSWVLHNITFFPDTTTYKCNNEEGVYKSSYLFLFIEESFEFSPTASFPSVYTGSDIEREVATSPIREDIRARYEGHFGHELPDDFVTSSWGTYTSVSILATVNSTTHSYYDGLVSKYIKLFSF
mgnify:CR=1 FL=1